MRDVLRNVRQYLAAAILRILPSMAAVDTPSVRVMSQSVEFSSFADPTLSYDVQTEGQTNQRRSTATQPQHPQRKGRH